MWIKLSSFGFVAAVLISGVALWNPLPENPSSENLSAAAKDYDVEIVRDQWGVPHILGKTDADTAFGLAFAHAEDDFDTIQSTIAVGRGHLARYKGVDAGPTDYLVSLFDVWGTIGRRFQSDVPADVKVIAEAYAHGLNLYAAKNPDMAWPGLFPATAEDIVAAFVFKGPFFYGIDRILLDLLDDERQAELALAPGTDQETWIVGPRASSVRGSNAIAVAPSRSTDGATRLVINSHQPLTGPVAWYEAHIKSEQGLDIWGGTFPGVPIILHGFTRDHGWANTINRPDLVDIYRLVRNPENPYQYRLDGEWRDFSVETVPIQIRLFGPFAFSIKREVLRTEHGPVIEGAHGDYAVRYAGMGEIKQLEQYYRQNQAKNFNGFMEALSIHALPSINYIYGDAKGNIAFIHNGQYPDRIPGWDWEKDLPGDRSELIWRNYLPFDQVPKLINPVSGLIFNANNSPFMASNEGNLEVSEFSSTMGLETHHTNRSLRFLELTQNGELIGYEDLLRIKFDTYYAEGSEADSVIKAVLSKDWSESRQLEAAAKHLADWDYNMNANSRHAALAGLTVLPKIMAEDLGEEPPEPAEAFRKAVDYLIDHYGRIDPEWGDLNRIVRGPVSLPLSGSQDTIRAVHPERIRDDGELHISVGDTWIAVLSWDKSGNLTAEVVHQFGSATLDRSSPHYGDQMPLYAEHKLRTVTFNEAVIRASAKAIYRPVEGEVITR